MHVRHAKKGDIHSIYDFVKSINIQASIRLVHKAQVHISRTSLLLAWALEADFGAVHARAAATRGRVDEDGSVEGSDGWRRGMIGVMIEDGQVTIRFFQGPLPGARKCEE